MAKKKKKTSARITKRKEPVRRSGSAAAPGAIPAVRPINPNELRVEDRERERLDIQGQGVARRNAFFMKQLEELAFARMTMDRVFMRNAIYRIDLCVEEHASAMRLTAAERREWKELASAAVADTHATRVPYHCEQLLSFWQKYLNA